MSLSVIIFLMVLLIFSLAILVRMFIQNRMVFAISAMGIVAMGILVFVSYHLFFYYGDDEIGVAMSTDEVHEDFVLNIESRKVRYELIWTSFVSPLNQGELKECIEEQHREAKIVPYGDEMRITLNNSVITVRETEINHFLFRTRHHYEMETECINLEKKASSSHVCVPFPKEFLDVEGKYVECMDILCDMEELQRFYQDFTNVDIRENEIVIHKDGQVRIRIEDGKVYITL